ncbi:alpha-tocopherol transfer protein-like [Stomoxys calcitrans]|uniref:CRAL-TRIO domain-containing protein n=1 Tax=Stomoxys calcitrans TaxID=35570 RepID=A0A1I8PEB7_STOCA|nr:alpha-tocopherol transfer protein-like [Stomoxys calcitrans]
MQAIGDAEQEKTIDYLQKWFEENKKLPNKIDRILLTRFYYCMYKDVEETKKLLEINYTIRNDYPHIYIERDPTDHDTINAFAYTDMVPLPGLTAENYRITFLRLTDFDPSMMHHTEDTKTFIMVSDCRFSIPDVVKGDTPLLSEGEVQIFDMNGYTMKHVARLSFRTLRTYLKFLQLAFPVRIKAMHMINCPSYLDKILMVVKPFISKEVFEMIHFHTNGIETLYDYVPKEMLPEEYGGNAGKLSDLKAVFRKTLEEKRDYLMDPNHWRVGNSK